METATKAKKIKKSTKKKTKTPPEEAFLELDGTINYIVKTNGVVTSRENIDGKAVLNLILAILKNHLDLMENPLRKIKK